jgi:hypothetical protein
MTHCFHCGGSMYREPIERIFQRAAPQAELICLLCGRSAGPQPDFSPREGQCVELGCPRDGTRDGRCPTHAAAFARIGTRRVG